tara:strand:- start:281 stop:430 length:150 start_codon:yes stop_codon:yes gene_type:complete
MLKTIFDILKIVDGETENIKIAKGKYAQPKNLKEVYKQFKRDLKWQQRK